MQLSPIDFGSISDPDAAFREQVERLKYCITKASASKHTILSFEGLTIDWKTVTAHFFHIQIGILLPMITLSLIFPSLRQFKTQGPYSKIYLHRE